MPKPGEHKTVQARILAYAGEIGWTVVPREEADRRRGLETEGGHACPLNEEDKEALGKSGA